MSDLTAKRTLVKSPPELWSELSEVERLARHLGAFGEIKITKLEPEHTVAWEGESASGTVSIEPSGWGTKVTLTAQLGDGEEAPATGAGVAEPPAAETEAEEGEEALPDGEESAEPAVDEPEVAEQSWERVGTAAAEEPLGEESVAAPPTEAGPMEAESMEADPMEAAPIEAESVADEPAAEESAVDTRVMPQQPGPIQARPRRRRGFLAWLFRPRTSAQAASPSEPVEQAPVIEEPPLVEEAPMAAEVSAPEDPITLEEPSSSEQPQVTVSDGPMVAQPPPGFAESARVMHEARPVPGGAPMEPEASPMSEEPDVSAEVAAAEQAAPPPGLDSERAQAILDEALDALGSAHHRPYSRG
jgi:hypothetical protein